MKRIYNLVIMKELIIIRGNLNIALKESALVWYIIEFLNLERVSLRVDENNVEE